MKRLIIIITTTITLFCLFQNVRAQEKQTAMDFLNIPSDAYTMSQGGAALGMNAYAFSYFNNTSAVSFAKKKYATGFSYSQWQPNNSNNTIVSYGGYYKLSKQFTIASGFKQFGYQSYNTYDNVGTPMGKLRPKEFSVGLGLAYKVSNKLSIGFNTKYLNSDFITNKGSTFAFDLSSTYYINPLYISISLSNFGKGINYNRSLSKYDLPSIIKIGSGYTFIFDKTTLSTNIEGDYLVNSSTMSCGFGTEFSIKDFASVRAGYHMGDDNETIPSYASIGIGFRISSIKLDFSYILAQSDSPINKSFNISTSIIF